MTLDGQPVDHEIVREDSTDLVARASNFELRFSITCTPQCPVQTNSQGQHVLEIHGQSALRITSDGWIPGSVIEVWISDEPTLLGQFEADSDGVLDVNMMIHSLTPGDRTLEVRGMRSEGLMISQLGVRVATTELVEPVMEYLPVAGLGSDRLKHVVVLLMALGGLLVLTSRRSAIR
jgi:hypothetical protein